MKLNKLAPKKNLAQAMVEFAIVLPLLLLLLYGLLEAGRLLFMYSTIVTASRQAVRYGSATGEGSTPGVVRYDDCDGIRLAANKVDYLNAFDHTSIDVMIGWDTGPNSTVNPICPTGQATDGWSPTGNTDRLVVTVTGHFNPIVPKIVPFLTRSIIATSRRTILTGVPIDVTPIGGSGGPGSPSTLALAMTATPTTYSFAGDVITYSFAISNSGSADLTGLNLALTHGVATNCPTTLAAGATATCQGSYTITAADVAAGSVTVQAAVSGSDGTNTLSASATVTLTFTVKPELTLAKSASTEYATSGGVVVYTFTLTNTGNVPLTAASVSDPKLGGTIASCGGDLAAGATMTCTANYTVTASDVNNATLNNTATATATYGTQTVTSNQAKASVYTGPLYLRATASPTSVNQPTTITYTYQLINNTGIPLYPPYTISGYRGTENCSTNTSSIPVGGSITCSGSYAVTQADIDTKTSLNNSITVVACNDQTNCNGASKQVTSYNDAVSVTIVQTPALTLGALTATYTSPINVGTVITYTYPVTNAGNVTLSPSITDTIVKNVTCPATFAPGATQSCTGTYTVTQADYDAGSITNTATASATFNGQSISSASQSYTVFTFVGPRLNLRITPNPTTFTGTGQFIVYTYTLTNTGSVPLVGPYAVTDNKVAFVDCSTATSPLAVGSSTTCVGSYATTQADLDTGHIIDSASITASDGTQTVVSNSTMAVVYVLGAPTLTPTATNTSTPTATATATATRTPTSTPTATNTPKK